MSSSAAIEFNSTFRRLLRTAQRIVPPERSKFVQFEIRRRFRTRESDDTMPHLATKIKRVVISLRFQLLRAFVGICVVACLSSSDPDPAPSLSFLLQADARFVKCGARVRDVTRAPSLMVSVTNDALPPVQCSFSSVHACNKVSLGAKRHNV